MTALPFPALSRADADTLAAEAKRWEASLPELLAVLSERCVDAGYAASRLRDGAQMHEVLGVPKPRIRMPAGRGG